MVDHDDVAKLRWRLSCLNERRDEYGYFIKDDTTYIQAWRKLTEDTIDLAITAVPSSDMVRAITGAK